MRWVATAKVRLATNWHREPTNHLLTLQSSLESWRLDLTKLLNLSRSVEDLDIGFVPSRPLLRLRSCLLLPAFFCFFSCINLHLYLHHNLRPYCITKRCRLPPLALPHSCPLWTNYCIVAAFKTSAALISPYLLSQALSLGYYCQDIPGLCITADLSVTHLSCPTGAHLDPALRLFSFREYLPALTVFLSLLDTVSPLWCCFENLAFFRLAQPSPAQPTDYSTPSPPI